MLTASCDTRPEHSEYQHVCVESHVQLVGFIPSMIGQTTVMQPMYQSVCDRTEVRCVIGKDGAKCKT